MLSVSGSIECRNLVISVSHNIKKIITGDILKRFGCTQSEGRAAWSTVVKGNMMWVGRLSII